MSCKEKTIMKKLNLLSIITMTVLFFMSFTNEEKITNTFKITHADSKYSINFCEKAITDANWCGFRFENKRNIIEFESGLKVEFFSRTEIGETNSNCRLTDYRDFSTDVWRLSPEGKIIHLVSKISKK